MLQHSSNSKYVFKILIDYQISHIVIIRLTTAQVAEINGQIAINCVMISFSFLVLYIVYIQRFFLYIIILQQYYHARSVLTIIYRLFYCSKNLFLCFSVFFLKNNILFYAFWAFFSFFTTIPNQPGNELPIKKN